MCTALSYHTKQHYFGRNLDIERGYNEGVVITPRNYPFTYRHLSSHDHHYAMIGMGTIIDNYPLYFEATNERGVSIDINARESLSEVCNVYNGEYKLCKDRLANIGTEKDNIINKIPIKINFLTY